jgi:hypothetical protein
MANEGETLWVSGGMGSGQETSRKKHRGGGLKSEQTSVLRKDLNESYIKHREELYWLRLELDVTRKEKEAVEDRMAELYRDLQEMQESKPKDPQHLVVDSIDNLDDIMEHQNPCEKCEGFIRIMSNQISMVRAASENVVRSLKEELSDLMDDKCQVEMHLINQLSELDTEKRQLTMRLDFRERKDGAPQSPAASTEPNGNDDAKVRELLCQVKLLTDTNEALARELSNERIQSKNILKENTDLISQVERQKDDLLCIRSSSDSVRTLDQMKLDREETLLTLEGATLLWSRADESIQGLESIMLEIKPRDDEDPVVDTDRERLLSTLESASLVHGQVKVSLMLIELKLRNKLAYLVKDDYLGVLLTPKDPAILQQVTAVEAQAMTAILQVQDCFSKQIEQLQEQSEAEIKAAKEALESRAEDLRQMQARQGKLEQDMTRLVQRESRSELKQENSVRGTTSVEILLSFNVLERLEYEVLQFIERVREKNELIGRLTATVQEHKVRERTLLDELKRQLKERDEAQRITNEEQDTSEENEVEDADPYDDEASFYEDETVVDLTGCEETVDTTYMEV